MRAPLRHTLIPLLLIVGVTMVLLLWERYQTHDRMTEDYALVVGRAVARRALTGDDEALQRLVEQAASLPFVMEIRVLSGIRFRAHSDPARAGKRLERDSLRDKALYDDARQLATIHRKNVVERRENPRLEGNAYPEVLFSRLSEALEVTLPAIDAQDAVKAVVSVKVAPPFLPPLPWWPLPLLLIVSFLLLLLVRGSLPLRVGLLVAGTGVCVLFSLQEAEKLEIVAIETRFPALAGMLGAFDPASMADLRGIDVHLDGGGKNLVPSRDFLACRPRTEFETEPLAMQLARKGTATLVSGKVACDLSGRAYAGKLAAHRRRITFLLGATLLVALALFTAFHRGLTARLWAGFQAHSLAYAYITPAMVGMLLLVFMPFSFGILLGFFKKIYNEYTFVGLSNFAAILFDFDLANPQNFYFTLGVTVLWTVVNVGLHVTIGLALALLLKEKLLRFRGVYRVLLIVPWAVPNYITALIWKGMFHKQFGSINYVLGLLGFEPIGWFQSFWTAFAANVATNTWLGFPFMMVVSLGALQSIPAELYEAADVDGATRWQKFFRITLPLLKPALFPAVIIGTIWTFNMFNIIYLVSGGAPNNSTDILITEAYRWAFERDQYGYAAAYSTIIFLILLGYTLLTNRVTKATKGVFE